MDRLKAERKVKQLFDSVMQDSSINSEVQDLMSKFSLKVQDLLDAWLKWDFDIQTYENQSYSSEAIRIVMCLHNYLEGSWHEKRQRIVLDLLTRIDPDSICEMGFGVPQLYVREFIKRKDKRLLLTDFDQTSIDVAKAILREDMKGVSFQILNMDDNNLPTGFDTYIFQDSIEHVENPTQTLKHFVNNTNPGANFVFSLPIEVEKPIPQHNICWKDEKDIENWLSRCGLKLKSMETIYMNPDIDVFAKSLNPDFREVVMLAEKI